MYLTLGFYCTIDAALAYTKVPNLKKSITPKFLVISGTEGNPAYKDYKFHINGVIGRGLIYAIICTAFVAGITFLLLRLLEL